jgi:type II secretory pathway component GspD/PulD (secretin)
LTVALNDVNVQQALDFITTMAGVRYALVGNTFVVATNERFANAMRQITNGQEISSQTRIIGLESGEGVQIKATVLKAVPQESVHGRYDMLLPTEMLTLETKMSASATGANIPKPAGGASGTGPGEAIKTDISAKAESGGNTVRPKDMYVVLVGLPQRLDEVERVVREVDSRLAQQGRVDIGKDIDTAVVPVFSGRVGEVAGALRRVIDRDAKRELYSIHESDSGSGTSKEDSVRLLVISGPRDSMKSVEAFAKGIDEGLCKSMGIAFPETQEDQARGFEVFDLKFVEPLEAATELEKHVPGIKASVLPSAARPNPRGSRTVSAGNAEGGSSSTGSTQPTTGGFVNPTLGVQGGGANSAPNNSSNGGASQGSGSGEDGFNLTKNMGAEPMKLLVRGNRGQMEQARQFLSVFDLAPKQVALELRVMELTKEEALKVGLDWSALTGGTVRFIRFNNGINPSSSTPGTISSGNPSSNLPADQGLSFGNGGFASVTATLDQLAGSLKMVARPNIIASEGRPTSIFVGDEVRYVESIVASQNGITVTTGQVNVGVKLNVTPRVGADGNLLLDLNPELSLLRGFTDVPGGGQLPQTSLRSTTSMVNLKSGETLAIGGLIQESDRKTVSGVPILMNLPIIGHFFKRTNNSKVRSEVVFFLTATEVGTGNRANAADPRASEAKIKSEIDKKNGVKG